jgi:hypothetical protein
MAMMLPLLYRLGQANGYLGERHVMLVVQSGLFWAVAGLAIVGAVLARRWPRCRAPLWTTCLLIALALLPLPKTLARLHGERKGFREAGEWLAANAGPDDAILDPFSWSSYYAGKAFVEGPTWLPTPEKYAYREHLTCWVVLDRSHSRHDHLRYLLDPVEEIAAGGVEVKRFSTGSGPRAGEVVIYKVSR